MWRNTAQNWGSMAKFLHWLFVILIVCEVPVGILMTSTYGPGFKAPAAVSLHTLIEQMHHTIGFSILGLVVLRLGWRLRNGAPAPDAAASRWSHRAAQSAHALLYLLLFLLPLSGWAALSVLGDSAAYGHTPIWIFNVDGAVPHLLPQRALTDTFSYRFFARSHLWLLYGGGVILTLHVLAALWHHWVRRDRTLIRMWPLTGGRRDQ
jgi:cytochrome b561